MVRSETNRDARASLLIRQDASISKSLSPKQGYVGKVAKSYLMQSEPLQDLGGECNLAANWIRATESVVLHHCQVWVAGESRRDGANK